MPSVACIHDRGGRSANLDLARASCLSLFLANQTTPGRHDDRDTDAEAESEIVGAKNERPRGGGEGGRRECEDRGPLRRCDQVVCGWATQKIIWNLVQAQKASSDILKIWTGRRRCHIDCARHWDVVSPRECMGQTRMKGTMRHSPQTTFGLAQCNSWICVKSFVIIWPGNVQKRSSGSKANIKLRFQYFQ